MAVLRGDDRILRICAKMRSWMGGIAVGISPRDGVPKQRWSRGDVGRDLCVMLLSSCADEERATTVVLNVRYDGAWGLDGLRIRVEDHDLREEPRPTIRLLVPQEWAGGGQVLRGEGLRGEEIWATAQVVFTPVARSVVEVDVALARLAVGFDGAEFVYRATDATMWLASFSPIWGWETSEVSTTDATGLIHRSPSTPRGVLTSPIDLSMGRPQHVTRAQPPEEDGTTSSSIRWAARSLGVPRLRSIPWDVPTSSIAP